MKDVLLFFLMIGSAVFLGLMIAFWYLSRFPDNSPRNAPRVVSFPEKHPPVDITPMTRSLDSGNQQIAPTGSPNDADVDGLMRRLAAIEAEQEHRPAPADRSQVQQAPLARPRQEMDDLKQISGIGPKLEEILNANGIFQFQQIADWQDADVQAMEELLPAFRGRIRREDWVGQARRLL